MRLSMYSLSSSASAAWTEGLGCVDRITEAPSIANLAPTLLLPYPSGLGNSSSIMATFFCMFAAMAIKLAMNRHLPRCLGKPRPMALSVFCQRRRIVNTTTCPIITIRLHNNHATTAQRQIPAPALRCRILRVVEISQSANLNFAY